MESRGASRWKKQTVVSKTSGKCEEDDEGRKSSTIPNMRLPDKNHSPDKKLEETQKLLHGNEQINSLKENMDLSDQQGQQSLQNVRSKSGKDKTEETLLENTYLHVRPSTSHSLNDSHEIGKNRGACEPLDSEQEGTTISSNSSEFESEGYSPDEDGEIKIISVTQLDDREPCQDHAAERILYCEPCANLILQVNLIPEAKCMCFTCEEYLCLKCASKHSDHLTLRVDEYKNEKDHRITEMLNRLKLEDDDERGSQMAESRYNICGRINVSMPRESPSPEPGIVLGVCISKDGNLLILTDEYTDSIKVFNMYNYKMIQCIKLSSTPHGITEIPNYPFPFQEPFADWIYNLGMNDSHTFIAVSFPMENQILVIHSSNNMASIVDTISILGAHQCREVFLCDGRLVTYCASSDPTNHTIKILNMPGLELLWTIDVLNLTSEITQTDMAFSISVREESNTIYISSGHDGCIVCIDITGNVREVIRTESIGTNPSIIHVDSDGNVFVSACISPQLPTGICKIRDHQTYWKVTLPSTWIYQQIWGIHTSRKGRLYCVDAYTCTQFVTVLQCEPSFVNYGQIGNL